MTGTLALRRWKETVEGERQKEKRKTRGAEQECLRFREAKRGKGERKTWTRKEKGGEA